MRSLYLEFSGPMPRIFSWSSDSDSDSRDCDARGIGKRNKLNDEDRNRQNASRTDEFATKLEQGDKQSEQTLVFEKKIFFWILKKQIFAEFH